jgi:hypothetical protein
MLSLRSDMKRLIPAGAPQIHALAAGMLALLIASCGRSETAGDSTSAAATPAASAPPAWVVSDSGAGPLRVGMSFAMAGAALHSSVPDTAKVERACAYVPMAGVPRDVRLMWVDGHLARIDVDNDSLVTTLGARVGDPAARIDSLYAGRVTTKPHKYLRGGSYLVVGTPSGSGAGARIVFETDSAQRVRLFRVGREPEVEWVEGCA